MRLRLSTRVPADLEEIVDYIAQGSPRHAVRVLRLLRLRMKEIAKQPQIYGYVQKLAWKPDWSLWKTM
jgi:plasmid stabilization system protein ParE